MYIYGLFIGEKWVNKFGHGKGAKYLSTQPYSHSLTRQHFMSKVLLGPTQESRITLGVRLLFLKNIKKNI